MPLPHVLTQRRCIPSHETNRCPITTLSDLQLDCLEWRPPCKPSQSACMHRLGRLDSVPSAVLVAAQLLFDCPSQELQQKMLVPVFTAVLPWSLVHHQSIRWTLAPKSFAPLSTI